MLLLFWGALMFRILSDYNRWRLSCLLSDIVVVFWCGYLVLVQPDGGSGVVDIIVGLVAVYYWTQTAQSDWRKWRR